MRLWGSSGDSETLRWVHSEMGPTVLSHLGVVSSCAQPVGRGAQPLFIGVLVFRSKGSCHSAPGDLGGLGSLSDIVDMGWGDSTLFPYAICSSVLVPSGGVEFSC